MAHTANAVAHMLKDRYPDRRIWVTCRDDGGGTLLMNGTYTVYTKNELEDLYTWLKENTLKSYMRIRTEKGTEYILVPKDDGFTSIEDLDGKIAFVFRGYTWMEIKPPQYVAPGDVFKCYM